jgi:protein-tyrosine phosphatase
MSGFVDLHCHFVPGIDDGARTRDEGLELLRRLKRAGFDTAIATPHMRPGLFDNTRDVLLTAFEAFRASMSGEPDIPEIGLSSEHYFDDIVFQRLLEGDGLPYPGGHAVLLEFYDMDFMPGIALRLFELRRRRLVPVIAHPERYRCFWKSHERLEELVNAGAAALLDVGALIGKYGKEPQKCARRMLEDDLYYAACSDAHRPDDVDEVEAGMKLIEKRYGPDEVTRLFDDGPRDILEGRVSQ